MKFTVANDILLGSKKSRIEYQKEMRKKNNNLWTKRYEKTVNGFLMRVYRNMKSRITGVQKKKYHLYKGKELWAKETFLLWTFNNPVFLDLFTAWEKSGYERKLTPSVDRIDCSKGYSEQNCEWVTHSENSRRSSTRKKNAINNR